MAFEMIVGLEIVDENEYQRYRDGMTPLLQSCGGSFRYDFTVAKTLKVELDKKMNRVFIMTFPDRATRDRFFADERYKQIRQAHWGKAVSDRTIIAEYDC